MMIEFDFLIDRFKFLAFSVSSPLHGRLVIDFFDEDRDALPLHLSIRPEEGKVVANDKIADYWGAEIVGDVGEQLTTPLLSIAISFLGKSGKFMLNGRTVLRLNDRRFNLSSIKRVRLNDVTNLSEIFVNRRRIVETVSSKDSGFNSKYRTDENFSKVVAFQKKLASAIEHSPAAKIESHLLQFADSFGDDPYSWCQFLISLSEYFCVKGQFDDLFQYWARYFNSSSFPIAKNNGTRSLLIPFHLRLGNYLEVANLLMDISKDRHDWVNLGCVSWTIEQCLTDPRMVIGSKFFVAIVDGFVELATTHAKSYWARSSCRDLVKASVLLAVYRHQLPEPMQSEVVRSIIQNYGLFRDFWDEIERACANRGQRVSELGPEFTAAYSAFKTVFAFVEHESYGGGASLGAVAAALRFFRNMGTYDASRVRMETFGLANLFGEGEIGLQNVIEEGDDGAEILLRHLAFPGSHHLSTTLSAYSRSAVRQRLQAGRQAGSLLKVEALLSECRKLCKMVQGGTRNATERSLLDNILLWLNRLSDSPEDKKHLGIGLALCSNFLRDGRTDLADVLSTFLYEQIDALPLSSARVLQACPLFRGAVNRFKALGAMSTSPISRALEILLRERIDPTLQEPEELGGAMTKLWIQSCALFDTLVLVYSSRHNLETRVAVARRTWLKRLQDFGIPYLIVIGDGTGGIEGDVLSVDAPDANEMAPRKALAMLAWAEKHTPFAHILKVDDSSFLGIEEYFFSLSYRQCDYYGRLFGQEIGSKSGLRPFAKLPLQNGQSEVEKSSTLSHFLNEGSAYALSRNALAAIRKALKTTRGQRLAASCSSGDKLVGDLLNIEGIQRQSDDCFVVVRCSSRPDGLAVLQSENSFYPSVMSGIKLAHLGADPDIDTCERFYHQGTLYPKKVWPTHSRLELRNSNQTLELISSELRLMDAQQAEVAVGAVVRNERFMLPHFLQHYRKLGVKAFLMVDNFSDDGTLEFLVEQPDVTVFSAGGSFRQAIQGTDWKIALMAQFRVGKWTLIADSDEFLVYPDYHVRQIADYLCDPMHGHTDAFLTSMIDMFPKGPLSEATFNKGGPFLEACYAERTALLSNSLSFGSFGNRPVRTSSLRHRLLSGSRPDMFVSEKVSLVKYKPWMRFSVSLHYASGVRLAKQNLLLAHFKYNSEFHAKAVREIKRGQYFNNSEEYRRYLDLISEGRDVIYNAETSVPWRDCQEVQAVLYSDTASIRERER